MVDVAERLDVFLVGILIASIRMEKVYAVDVGFGTIIKGSEKLVTGFVLARKVGPGNLIARDSITLSIRVP